MKRSIALSMSFLSFAAPAVAEVGDFSIPAVNPLNSAQLEALRELAEEDPEAGAIALEITQQALPLLDARPRPLEVIHYEGLVNTDPRRIATVAKLKQMGNAARLVRYWQVSGDQRAASVLRRFIVAWTGAYKLTGNDVKKTASGLCWSRINPLQPRPSGLLPPAPENAIS